MGLANEGKHPTNSRKPQSPIVTYASAIVEHRLFTPIVIIFILFNAILVGLETYPSLYVTYGSIFHYADVALLWIFTVEIALRLIATRPTRDFFKSSWNWFDFIIVLSGHLFVGGHFITVLRILRVLRVLRAISVIPSLRRLVDALLLTVPALGNIIILMSIVFYIFAVIGTMLFAKVAPEYFGNLQLSLLTLFQVVTLESWASGVMRPIFLELPWSWLYFVLFILVGTFIIFNLFIGVIVSNVEKANELEAAPLKEAEKAAEKQQMDELKQEIRELKEIVLRLEKNK